MRIRPVLVFAACLCASTAGAEETSKVTTLDMVEIVSYMPGAKAKKQKEDPIRCHRESGVRVCRPDSKAADLLPGRSTTNLVLRNRSLDFKALVDSVSALFPQSFYRGFFLLDSDRRRKDK